MGTFPDGNTMILTSGLTALSPLLDFAELEGLSRWVETQAELDSLLPPLGASGACWRAGRSSSCRGGVVLTKPGRGAIFDRGA